MVRSAPGSALALSGARLEPSGTHGLLPSFETPREVRTAPQDEACSVMPALS
jgi:hypothetical protein